MKRIDRYFRIVSLGHNCADFGIGRSVFVDVFDFTVSEHLIDVDFDFLKVSMVVIYGI